MRRRVDERRWAEAYFAAVGTVCIAYVTKLRRLDEEGFGKLCEGIWVTSNPSQTSSKLHIEHKQSTTSYCVDRYRLT
jgi:DNA-binding transcriptional regulator PaaX